MIIQSFTDNDLYKFTTMNAIQKLYPNAMVKYKFIDRNNTEFPEGFADALRKEVDEMSELRLTVSEESFMRSRGYYLDPVFIDLLKGYQYNPWEVRILQKGKKLDVEIEGLWYRAVLWEVPLLAIISELYYKMTGQQPAEVEERAREKAKGFLDLKAEYSEFGTRRRFSFDVHDRVLKELKAHSGGFLKGSSNVFLAMKHQLSPIGTHPHEWFMYHAVHFGYKQANTESLKAWTNVYHGDLGIALTDTFTTQNFLNSFSTQYAKIFDGVRWDSGDPIDFTDKLIDFYKQKRIDPRSKTIVYSDALNVEKIKAIREYVNGKIHDVYGIGTFITNDVGVEPLNIVIKLTHAKSNPDDEYYPTVKLSDVASKQTGTNEEIKLCKQVLRI